MLTFKKMIEACEIFGQVKGMDASYCFEGGHDMITCVATPDDIPPDSPEGLRLASLDWFVDEDSGHWAIFT